MGIGDRIRIARKARKLSQAAVGKHFGISREAVSMWETEATTPEAARIFGLADLLQVRLDWLVYGRLPMEPLKDLSEDAVNVADAWQHLGPRHRQIVRELIDDLLHTPGADCPAVDDRRVEAAYGLPAARAIHEPEVVYIPAPHRRQAR